MEIWNGVAASRCFCSWDYAPLNRVPEGLVDLLTHCSVVLNLEEGEMRVFSHKGVILGEDRDALKKILLWTVPTLRLQISTAIGTFTRLKR